MEVFVSDKEKKIHKTKTIRVDVYNDKNELIRVGVKTNSLETQDKEVIKKFAEEIVLKIDKLSGVQNLISKDYTISQWKRKSAELKRAKFNQTIKLIKNLLKERGIK